MARSDLIRLTHADRCGLCGKKVAKGTLVKEIKSRERMSEIVCPACLMKNGGKIDPKNVLREPVEFNKKKGK